MAENLHQPASILKVPKPRPYWHVDLKWIFGLLLLAVTGWWLLLLVAYRITAPSTGVALTTNLLSYIFSRGDLDNPAGVSELRAKIAQTPTGSLQPIPGFPVTITLHDVDTLSPRDLRLKIFGQIASPLYYKGVEGYAKEITNDPAQQKKFENDATLLNLVTQDRHAAIGKLAVMTGIVAFVLLAGMVYFSAGFGRFVAPAFVLLALGLPGSLIFTGLRAWSTQPAAASAQQSESVGAIVDATKGSLTPALASAQKIYLVALATAVVLLLAAIIGKIVAAIFVTHKKAA